MSSRPAAAAAVLSVVALSAVAFCAAVPAQAAPAGEATVSVLHGVPGLKVDVFANGKALLPDFQPGTLTEPLKLPAGSYDIKIFKAGEGPNGTPAIEKKIDVPGGANATLVAHLSADGKPVLDAFVNDTSKIPAGQARLTVRHVAAAPAVDVRAGGTPLFKALENPKEASATVPAGTVKADVVLAGTGTVAIGPADLNLKEGTNTVVYAWGNASDKSLALKTQVITGLHSAPSGVKAGESGEASSSLNTVVPWLIGAGVLALAGAGVAGRRAVAARR
ncbi:DUF4397 domain-containing protein [Kitasatospora indigofera]|uniref:DUF4397 domain-containing protein n=1 Tax=Kitasatospora indigofera TaxID=67307 RepID=UPI0036CFA17A